MADADNRQAWPTGHRAFDQLLGGGLPRARLTALLGDSGSGKSSVAHWLCRAIGGVNRYSLALRPPIEALAQRQPEPRPNYIDLSPTILADGLDGAVARLDALAAEAAGGLLVVDDVGGLLAPAADEFQRRIAFYRLNALLWAHDCTGIVTGPVVSNSLGALTATSAALVLALRHGDSQRPRRLEVIKHENRSSPPGEHPFRITAHGFVCGSERYEEEPQVVSSLGTRVLALFRTARTSSAAEVAALLGEEPELVESALMSLALSGYLETADDEGGERIYRVALPA